MVQPLNDLGPLEKDLIKILQTRKKRSATIDQIPNLLFAEAGISPTRDKISDALGELIEYGSVRAYRTKDAQGNLVRKYYLSTGLGSGKRNQDTLYGKSNLFRDIGKLWYRIFGSIFVLFGLGVIINSGMSLTGNAVFSGAPVADIGLILAFALGIIGIVLISSEK